MTELAERLLKRYYAHREHPYRTFEKRVAASLPADATLLDAGCGRTTPVLKKFMGQAKRLIGVELVEFTDVPAGIETHNADLARIPVADASVDVIMSRSVFEHLEDPDSVYRECFRVLKPGGTLIFLTANLWDYGSLAARLIPNRFHPAIVKHVEGRAEEDTFPIQYRTNTRRAVKRLAQQAGLEIRSFDYLSQYPNYLMFNGALFYLGTCFERLINRFDLLKGLRGWILVTLTKPAQGT